MIHRTRPRSGRRSVRASVSAVIAQDGLSGPALRASTASEVANARGPEGGGPGRAVDHRVQDEVAGQGDQVRAAREEALEITAVSRTPQWRRVGTGRVQPARMLHRPSPEPPGWRRLR